MDYSALLDSPNYQKCLRGIRMFNSDLETNPCETLNNFHKYSKSLIHIFFDLDYLEIAHLSITEAILRYARLFIDQLSKKAKLELVLFCLECCKECNSDRYAFFLSLDIFRVEYYSDFIKSIISGKDSPFSQLSIKDLLVFVEFKICEDFLMTQMDHIFNQLSKSPKETADIIVRILKRDQTNKVAVNRLKNICKKNSTLLQYIPTETLTLFLMDKELNILLQSHSKKSYPALCEKFAFENQIIRFCKSPTDVIKKESIPEYVPYKKQSLILPPGAQPFSIVHEADNLSKMCLKKSPFEKFNQTIAHNTKRIKIDTKSENTPNSTLMRNRGASIVLAPKLLHEWGVKKGGIGHSKWQKRYFEFFSSARCIIWRESPESLTISGLVIIQDNTIISPALSHKGYYKIRIDPSQGEKKYEIAFEKESICNQWAQALQSLCTK
ncbi:PH domain containing protein [Trichomonas vaginalis G3]|uniref:PH domain containing protein n=1 Tax=Trichomonas vaginalis (strain ATCC PRA-98 / G3) TaxID=412133 RepID=A2F1C8_TRIV3|nr:PH domain-like family [Trichomonas vaginalis G3]EAY01292.1 PH domain containing protein [Trichomonas vaginalis G3]KAI5542820.1 PH domain-like family [Trichomonas vaginalis G3]|eukprot:XP_001330160.1 PH domain containing protein [Trichomonas vaginalis G3]